MGSNLRERATAPARQGQPSLAQLIEQMKPEIGRALPKHLNPDRMARIATTLVRQTPALARCTPESFLGALLTASQLGLEPGPLGDAYLVPYGNQVTFVAGYRGLIRLAYQSGEVSTIDAQIVREGDDFDYRLGLDPFLTHKPQLMTDEIAKPIAVYAVCIRKDGSKSFRVMSIPEIERIRRRSKASNNGPWKTDWESMAKKTVVKQLAKFMPLSSDRFNAANVQDGGIRTETRSSLVDVAPTYVEDLGPAIEAPTDDAPPTPAAAADEPPFEPDPPQEAPTTETPTDTPAPAPTAEQLKALDAAFTAQKYAASDGSREEWLSNHLADKISSVRDLTGPEVQDAIDTLTGK